MLLFFSFVCLFEVICVSYDFIFDYIIIVIIIIKIIDGPVCISLSLSSVLTSRVYEFVRKIRH